MYLVSMLPLHRSCDIALPPAGPKRLPPKNKCLIFLLALSNSGITHTVSHSSAVIK
jgi:hypothetical protein